MSGRLRLTILVDNNVRLPGLIAEHGLSMLIEAGGNRILFDTGQRGALFPNARTLGCPLDSLDAIVISHGHYDHTGGLGQVLSLGGRPRIFLHPAALGEKFTRRDSPPHRPIGIPPASLEAAEAARDRLVGTRSSAEIAPGVWCTGEIPRVGPGNFDNSRFFLDAGCREPDPLVDDQALFFQSSRGVIVLCGCAHAGVVNTLDHVASLAGTDEIFAVIGGFHLKGAPVAAWDAVCDALRKRNVRLIAPCHCTGPAAWTHLFSQLGTRVEDAGAGSRFELD